jgi:ribosomal protein L40E
LWRIYARIALGIIDVKPITLFSDIVMPNAVKSHVFEVGDNIERLTTMLSYRGSKLNLELVSPDGDVINSSRPNIIFIEGIGSILAIVSSPLPGRWEARVIGVDVPPKGEPYILSIGVNALSISPRELSVNATQLEREIKLMIRNDGEITASNVTVYVDGPLKDYIYVNPVKFTIGRGENVTLDVKVSKPDSYAKRSARIILDNNGFRYVVPVNLILKGLIINAWTRDEIYVGERAVLNVIVFDDSYSPVTNAKVTVSIDGETIMLNDNGVSPDTIADDGLYAGFFTPTSLRLITLNIRAEKDNYLPALMPLSLRVLELSPLNLLISFPHQLTRGDPLIINSTLLDVNGNRVDGGSIEAIINGIHHKFVEITPGFYQLKIDTTNASRQLLLEIEAIKRGFLPVKKNITITILEKVTAGGPNIPIINYGLLILLVLILFIVFISIIAYSYSRRGIICTSCGFKNRRGATYCRNCGNRLRS